MPNFSDINDGAHIALNTGFGMTAASPLDLRTIVTNLYMLDAMIAAHWMCEGMLVYDLNTKKYYQIYTNDQNQIDRKLFEIEASQIETATTADHLSHSVTINGVLTDFSGTEVNINRLMPTLISNYAQDFDSKTTPGQYYGADGNDNNYLLTIEAIGDDKLIRTMITIENGHIVAKQAIATQNGNVWTWGDWTLADGSVATAHISWLSPNVYINKPGGSLAERWIYSDAGSQYTASAATVQTSDGQTYTVANPPAAAIDHPFVVRLFSNGVTKTATVESLKATNDVWGKVKLSDSVTDDSSGVNSGVATTPKAAASLNERITKVNDSVAAGFSEATDYAVGDYVTHGFELYRCTIAHDAGDWNDAHFSKATTTDELKAEATARETADTTLQTNIDDEATARENADATKADLTDLAADFSASTAYAVGDYVTHAGDLFRCTTAHAAGDWNAGHFKRVKVGDELKAKADLTDLAAEFSASTAYEVGDYVTHDGDLFRCTTAHNAGDWNAGHFTQVAVGTELKAKAPTNHKSTATTYGVGDNDEYGHVKLSDSLTQSAADNTKGLAATPKAVNSAVFVAIAGIMGLFRSKKVYYGECSGSEVIGSTRILTIEWLYGNPLASGKPSTFNENDLVILKFTANSIMQSTSIFIKTNNDDTFLMPTYTQQTGPGKGEVITFIRNSGYSLKQVSGTSLIID